MIFLLIEYLQNSIPYGRNSKHLESAFWQEYFSPSRFIFTFIFFLLAISRLFPSPSRTICWLRTTAKCHRIVRSRRNFIIPRNREANAKSANNKADIGVLSMCFACQRRQACDRHVAARKPQLAFYCRVSSRERRLSDNWTAGGDSR